MGGVFSFILPYRKYFSFYKVWDKFYFNWIKSSIGYVGEHVIICSHCSMIGGEFMKFRKGSSVDRYARLEAWQINGHAPEIIFGEGCCIGQYCHISASNRIVFGKNVLTGRRVTIIDNNHGLFVREQLDINPLKRPVTCKGEIIIGDNVWIGENVVVLSGVKIGMGSVIAANAVVSTDIPPYSLAAGVPAKVIKSFQES